MKHKMFRLFSFCLALIFVLCTACSAGEQGTAAAPAGDQSSGKIESAVPEKNVEETQPEEAEDPAETEDPAEAEESEGTETAGQDTEDADTAGTESEETEIITEEQTSTEETEQQASPKETEVDFSRLTGVWFDEIGHDALLIFPNGGFQLQDWNGFQEGELVYTEEDGGMWESGPRFEMSLENNERLYEDAYLVMEDDPDELIYVIGGGAVVMTRQAPDWATDDGLVQVRFPDGPMIDCTVAELVEGDDTAEVVFTALGTVRDLQFYELALEDVDDEGNPTFAVETVYQQDWLTGQIPLVVVTAFYGDIPNNGFSYTDGAGETHRYYISLSGYDGSLYLGAF